MGDPLVEINNLTTSFKIEGTYYPAIDHVQLNINQNEVLAIVGESGCGKSTLATSMMGLHDMTTTKIEGQILFHGKNLLDISSEEWETLRGKHMGMIFQDPLSALNPLQKIGAQIKESLNIHTSLSEQEKEERVIELLEQVGIDDAVRIAKQFPHQLSGGQRQRVMIAIAIACKPELIIADEPTTALDVTIQAQILELLLSIQKENHAGIIMITHDLGVVAEVADRVAVMYAGEIVELAPVKELFSHPCHPYTRSLLKSIPDLKKEELYVIPGSVPSLTAKKNQGCRFSERLVHPCLHEDNPSLHEVKPEHFVRCICYKTFSFD